MYTTIHDNGFNLKNQITATTKASTFLPKCNNLIKSCVQGHKDAAEGNALNKIYNTWNIKQLLITLLFDPWWIFLNCLASWTQDGNATRPLPGAEVPAGSNASAYTFYSLSSQKHFNPWIKPATVRPLPRGSCERRRRVALCGPAASRPWRRWGSRRVLWHKDAQLNVQPSYISLTLFVIT